MEEFKINIFEQISSNAAVSSDDGNTLFEKIVKVLSNDVNVILDFSNIELITSTFLNASIGQLYGKYDNEFIRTHLKVENMTKEDLNLLKIVTDRAKEYFKDKNKIDNIVDKLLNEE